MGKVRTKLLHCSKKEACNTYIGGHWKLARALREQKKAIHDYR
jgi:hypothetical protein